MEIFEIAIALAGNLIVFLVSLQQPNLLQHEGDADETPGCNGQRNTNSLVGRWPTRCVCFFAIFSPGINGVSGLEDLGCGVHSRRPESGGGCGGRRPGDRPSLPKSYSNPSLRIFSFQVFLLFRV